MRVVFVSNAMYHITDVFNSRMLSTHILWFCGKLAFPGASWAIRKPDFGSAWISSLSFFFFVKADSTGAGSVPFTTCMSRWSMRSFRETCAHDSGTLIQGTCLLHDPYPCNIACGSCKIACGSTWSRLMGFPICRTLGHVEKAITATNDCGWPWRLQQQQNKSSPIAKFQIYASLRSKEIYKLISNEFVKYTSYCSKLYFNAVTRRMIRWSTV